MRCLDAKTVVPILAFKGRRSCCDVATGTQIAAIGTLDEWPAPTPGAFAAAQAAGVAAIQAAGTYPPPPQPGLIMVNRPLDEYRGSEWERIQRIELILDQMRRVLLAAGLARPDPDEDEEA